MYRFENHVNRFMFILKHYFDILLVFFHSDPGLTD
jgi:hypothetical protein